MSDIIINGKIYTGVETISVKNTDGETVVFSKGASANDIIDGTITEVTSDILSGVESIRNNAFSGMGIKTVSVPSNVTSIGDSAFANNNITTLTLADGVETIGNNAFQNNSITELIIPASITSIGDSAFAGNNLTKITMESDTPPIVTSTTFPATLRTTNVSYNGYDNYATNSNWETYKNTLVRGLAIPSTITVTVNNYLGEFVNGATVTIEGNGITYTGTTDTVGTFTQGDLQPATYTISVGDIEGLKTPESQEVVVEQDTQNSVIITYLEKPEFEFSRTFSENTPATISMIADEISAQNMTSAQVEETYGWKIGDTINVPIDGSNYKFRIIGFNHDYKYSGEKAGITLEMVSTFGSYPMNQSRTTLGGYAQSYMRTTALPEIKSYISQDWQDVIVDVVKKSTNGGRETYYGINTTKEDIFLLSASEVVSSTATNVNRVQEFAFEGDRYEYYKLKGVVSKGNDWWLRSVNNYTSGVGICISGTSISNPYMDATARYVSFAFCVGGKSTSTPKYSRIFAENTPAQIAEVGNAIATYGLSEKEIFETYGWALGDVIKIPTSGYDLTYQIIGFNHDDLSDGSGKAGITLNMSQSLYGQVKMYSSTNTGGYPTSYFRNNVLPNIRNTIPQGWRDVFVKVDKKSANGGGSNYTETVTSSEDLFVLSVVEYSPTYASETNYVTAGETEGTQYELWAKGGSIKQVASNNYNFTSIQTRSLGNSATSITDIWYGNYYQVHMVSASDGTYNTSLAFCVGKPKTFAEYTPAEISAISKEISAKNMTSAEMEATYNWKVGDTKDITLTTGEVIQMRIIGVNHDTLSSGLGTAGLTLEMVDCLKTKYTMNNTATSAGGYPSTDLRNTTLPSIKSTLPLDWQNIIVMVNKKSANGGSSYTETLTTSEDLFLLSEIEIFNNIKYAQDGNNEGICYEYWQGKTNADRIKRVNNAETSRWLRSCDMYDTSFFSSVSDRGDFSSSGARLSIGLSFAFCV